MGRRDGVIGVAIVFLLGLIPALSFAQSDADPFPRPAIPYDPAHYLCYRAVDSIRIDGRLDEKDWADAEWTTPFVDIEGSAKPAPRFTTRAKMLWDDENFYVAASMEEPHVWAKLTERDAVIYYDNDFEVFIDPDGDTHNYYELEINALGTEWDLFLVKPYRDGGPAIHGWDIKGLRSAVFIDGTINDPSDTDRGWSVEIAFPWTALGEHADRACPPKAGDQWRLNFSRVQWQTETRSGNYEKVIDPATGKSLSENNWVWSPQGLVNMHYPEMWGGVQFSRHTVHEQGDLWSVDPDAEARLVLRDVYYRMKSQFMQQGHYTDELPLAIDGVLNPSVYLWPPKVHATPNLFEVALNKVDGETLFISDDGRIWAEEKPR